MNSNLSRIFLICIIEGILLSFVVSVLANSIPTPTPIHPIILFAIALLLTIILIYLQVIRPQTPTRINRIILAVIAFFTFFLVILFGTLIWAPPPPICLALTDVKTLTDVKNHLSTGDTSLIKQKTPNEKDREQQIYENNKKVDDNNSYLLAVAIPAKAEPEAARAMLAGVADAQTKFNEREQDPTIPTKSEKRLKIVVVDDQNDDNNFAKEVACQIAQDPKWKNILGVIGHHSSGASIEALKIYEKAGITMITPTSTSTELNQKSGKVFFRTTVNNEAFGSFLAEKIKLLGKVRVFYEGNNKYAEDLKKQFIQALGTNQVKAEDTIDIKNWTSANANIDDLKIPPEFKAAVIFSSSGDGQKHQIAIELIKKLKSIRPDLNLFGGDSLYKGRTLYEGKTDIEGLKLVIPWFRVNSDGEIISGYVKKSEATWGGQINWMTASSYDATQAFLAAIAEVERTSQKVDRKSVLESMRKVDLGKEYISGERLKFDNNGEPQDRKPIFVEVVRKDNKWPCGFEVCFKPVE